MADFDPVPTLNPFFRGLVAAILMVFIALAAYGAIALAVVILVGAGR